VYIRIRIEEIRDKPVCRGMHYSLLATNNEKAIILPPVVTCVLDLMKIQVLGEIREIQKEYRAYWVSHGFRLNGFKSTYTGIIGHAQRD
jgi:hypothetical protein